MSHNHHHHSNTGARLLLTMILNFVITIVEVIGGLLSGSLSLISDALHNFSDGVSVIISWIAIRLKEKDKSYRHTFGLKRAEILAAVINSSVLLVITLYLFYEAVLRFYEPQVISGGLMTGVAAIGLVANIVGTLLLARDAKTSLNIKSAYLHLLSDAISSFGVILGGLAIVFWNVYWVDPLLTFLIGLYILKESYEILQQAVHVLMEGAPTDISIRDIQKAVEAEPQVQNIHHIHIWTVGENDVHLEGHVNIEDMLISESNSLLSRLEHLLREKFNIRHITLQFECNRCPEVGLINHKIKKS